MDCGGRREDGFPALVFRRGSQRELSITVAELEPERTAARTTTPEPPKAQSSNVLQALGLSLTELTAAEKKELSLKGGVRVASAEGPAARAGLREGDVIVAIANTDTASVKEVEAALGKVEKTRPINVLFRRGEWAQYAVIRAPR